MMKKSEEFYNLLVHKISVLCFGIESVRNNPDKVFVSAWLVQNELGPEDIGTGFDEDIRTDTRGSTVEPGKEKKNPGNS